MTDNERNAVLEYERILQSGDPKKKLSTTYFRLSDQANCETAINILRYIFDNILRWTPEEVANRASHKMIQDLHLTIPYNKLIFPNGLSKKRDYFYMAHLLYPDKIHSFSKRNLVIYIYKQILNKEAQTPTDYFLDADGYYKASVCLQYALTQSAEFIDTADMYKKFNDPKFAGKYLKEKKLDKVCRDLFNNNPLDYLEYSIPAGQADSLTFFLLKFNNLAKQEGIDKQWSKALTKGEKHAEYSS